MQEGKLAYALLFSLAIHVFLFSGILPRSISETFRKERELWMEIEIEPSIPPMKNFLPSPSLPLPRAVIQPSALPLTKGSSDPPPAPMPPTMEPQWSSPPLSWVLAHAQPLDRDLAKEAASEKPTEQSVEPRLEENASFFPSVPVSLFPPLATAHRSAKDEKGPQDPSPDLDSTEGQTKVATSEASKLASSEDSSLFQYLAMVRKKIEAHRRYPTWARRNGWEGKAVLEFRIGKDGGLRGIRVVETSGYRILDEAAKEAIERASPYPPLPSAQNEFLDARIPIAFRLEENPWGKMERR